MGCLLPSKRVVVAACAIGLQLAPSIVTVDRAFAANGSVDALGRISTASYDTGVFVVHA